MKDIITTNIYKELENKRSEPLVKEYKDREIEKKEKKK